MIKLIKSSPINLIWKFKSSRLILIFKIIKNKKLLIWNISLIYKTKYLNLKLNYKDSNKMLDLCSNLNLNHHPEPILQDLQLVVLKILEFQDQGLVLASLSNHKSKNLESYLKSKLTHQTFIYNKQLVFEAHKSKLQLTYYKYNKMAQTGSDYGQSMKHNYKAQF